jgi:RimJ/RimL family protein N-acetyltransferase
MPVEEVRATTPASLVLEGTHVRLEPLGHHHADALIAALNSTISADPSLYQWSLVPRTAEDVAAYIKAALTLRDAGTAIPFATIRKSDNAAIGSTRFFELERWSWPTTSPHHNAHIYDTGEIGYTWLTASAIRTAANTEAKLLMLTHAFESWNANSIHFCTDERNTRSAAAIQRTGAKFEGILRAHRMAADYTPRNTMRFSIIASEWPAAKQALLARLRQPR